MTVRAPTGRVKVSVRGFAFTGDVRLAVEIYEFMRKTPLKEMPPTVSGFFVAMHEDLHRVYQEANKK